MAVVLLSVSATNCRIQEMNPVQEPLPQPVIEFTATIESPQTPASKVYTDESLRILWHADDRISIFNQYTYNREYVFMGETGDNAGGFAKASGGAEYVTGNDLENIYAVYPYQESTKINNDGNQLTIYLPTQQHWAPNSFGRGALTMVSATTDNELHFRNAVGFLVMKLYGTDVQVSEVVLKSNSGELLSGKALVSMPVDGLPAVAMQEGASDQISLVCDTPVTIGSSAEDFTEFWFALPPTDFTAGFTISVTDPAGAVFEMSTSHHIEVVRNSVSKMAALEVVPTLPVWEPELVDLGLTVKWASFNLGANQPEQQGYRYAWGETEPKETYSWSTYQWCGGSSNSITKYTNVYDYKHRLDLEDDAAHVKLGGLWRMPTTDEWAELCDPTKCNWEWTTENDVNGYRITSLIDGHTDQSIFLPDFNSLNDYWSSFVRRSNNPEAGVLRFNATSVNNNSFAYRYEGLLIRPVYGAPGPNTNFSPNSYIIWRRNPVENIQGDNYYRTETVFSGFSASVVEIKFQLASSSDYIVPLASSGNEATDFDEAFGLTSDNKLVWRDGSQNTYFDLSPCGVTRTSSITLKLDGTANTITVNGNNYSFYVPYFSYERLFASYYYENDDGRYSVYTSIPNGSTIYYCKGWDSNGNLIYLSYPTKALNPATSSYHYCWYTYYNGQTSYQFANASQTAGSFSGNLY